MHNDTTENFRQLEFAPLQTKIYKLLADRRFRDKCGLFYAEGIRNFVTAVDNNYPIDALVYSEKLLTSPIARKIVRNLKRSGVPFARATPEQFRSISETERASGVAVVLRQQIRKLDQLEAAAHFGWIALSDVRSLGNFGTLIRTAAATGAGGFVLIGDAIDPFDPNVVRATMGALFKQQFARCRSVAEFAAWAKTNKLQVVGASPGGAVDYDKFGYQSPTIIMLGNERKGLTADEQRVCGELVRIPMTVGTDSLNVAVAGSLLLYEAFRRARRE